MGIPRGVRDFQARWESPFLDFSTERLSHSFGHWQIGLREGRAVGCVVSQPVRPVGHAEGPVEMLMHRYHAAGQRRSPADWLNLQAKVLETDRVIAIHRALELQGENKVQILARPGQEGATPLGCRYLKAAVELGDVVFPQKVIGRLLGCAPRAA